MIARCWSARGPRQRAPQYATHLETHVLPALRGIAGYVGATLLQRDVHGDVEVVVITWWQSLDAVRAFAGDDVETAVVADEAAALFNDYDHRVRHFDVMMSDGDGRATR
jgi:heme-degrading monooxygenase HmoA